MKSRRYKAVIIIEILLAIVMTINTVMTQIPVVKACTVIIIIATLISITCSVLDRK